MKPRLKYTEQGWYGYVQEGDYYKQIWGVDTAENAYNILKNFKNEHRVVKSLDEARNHEEA